MARKTSKALALALSAALALGTIPAPALAEMAEGAMGAEPAAAARPTSGPASTPAHAKDPAPAESQMGEEPAVPQADLASASESELGTAPAPAQPDAAGLATQSLPTSGTWGTCPWEIDGNGKLTIRPGTGVEAGPNPNYQGIILSPWADHADEITSVVCKGEGGKKVAFPKDSSDLFFGLGKVTTMDLSGADTSKVTSMDSTFGSCTSLASIEGLSGWDTSKVTSMGGMFQNCTSLASLDLSRWDTSAVTYMGVMFQYCTSLTSLDLSRWDTSHVTQMGEMFYHCDSLISVGDLSGWDTSALGTVPHGTPTSVGFVDFMFYGCTSLTSLDLSGWDTSHVTYMGGMFCGCSSLTSLDLSGWDTSKVGNMVGMFSDCSSLTSLDLSGWDTSKVTYAVSMFSGCPKLASITVGARYAMQSADMFPEPTAANGKWWSTKEKRWLTKDEVVSSRSRVADTYVSRAAFPDVAAGAWYADVVSRAVGLGLMSGYEDGKFGPADKITRGQVAVVLWNMAGNPAAGPGAKSFPDVASNQYFYNAVRWASSKGVVSGYGNRRFGPNDDVTREELAAMLANYARSVRGRTVTGSKSDFSSMRDRDRVSGWAVSSVGWCFRNNILSGAGGNVNPHGNAARAEAAKMVVFLRDMLG